MCHSFVQRDEKYVTIGKIERETEKDCETREAGKRGGEKEWLERET